MKSVRRVDEPESLVKNGARWKTELLGKIKECRRENINVPDSFYDKYNKPDVKKSLKLMFTELCCYCESRIPMIAAQQIEHWKPKKKYPIFTYDWDNLLLVCVDCNIAKGEKFNEDNPILKPVLPEVTEDQFTYEVDITGISIVPLNERAIVTENHAKLNRPQLKNKIRQEIFNLAWKMVNEINKITNNVEKNNAERKLLEFCRREHGTLIRFVMERNLN